MKIPGRSCANGRFFRSRLIHWRTDVKTKGPALHFGKIVFCFQKNNNKEEGVIFFVKICHVNDPNMGCEHIIDAQRYTYRYVCMHNVQTTNLPENLSPSCSQHLYYASYSAMGHPKPLRIVIRFSTKPFSQAFWVQYPRVLRQSPNTPIY